MKIVVITGSPRREGNSDILVNNFIKGALESGNEVIKFDSAFKKVHPCIACEKCKTAGACAFDDDFTTIKDDIIDCDLIVFASPIYYYAVSAQIKTTIDRFYAIDEKLHKDKKAAVILTFADTSLDTANLIINNFNGMFDFLGWKNIGGIIAPGVWGKNDVNNTDFPKKAYEFGLGLK